MCAATEPPPRWNAPNILDRSVAGGIEKSAEKIVIFGTSAKELFESR
jgi:hypothetical protein